MRDNDEALMLRVKLGDLEAFETLVDRLKVPVFSLCFHILRSREDAEEAAQDCFLKLFRAREAYQVGRSVVPWVLKIATNSARDLSRRRKVHLRVAGVRIEDEEMNLSDPRDDSESRRPDPDEIRSVLDDLSQQYRALLVLKYFQNLSNQQIADCLGISLSNMKVKLARARDVVMSRLRTMQGGR